MPLKTMLELVPGSPEVALVTGITSVQTTFNIGAAPDLVPPMLITICDRSHFETVLVTDYTAPAVTVAARGRQGTARAWSAGSVVVIGPWCEEHYETLKENVIAARKNPGSLIFLAQTIGAL